MAIADISCQEKNVNVNNRNNRNCTNLRYYAKMFWEDVLGECNTMAEFMVWL